MYKETAQSKIVFLLHPTLFIYKSGLSLKKKKSILWSLISSNYYEV